jgi:hypothetical protein
MTKSVDRYFEILDACVAAGGVLSEFAASMIDTIATGGPLETTGAGVVGRWRVEARQVLRRRAMGDAAPTGNSSQDARALRAALLRYAASEQYQHDKRVGGVPAGENARLFLILCETGGKVPSWETLRKRSS